MKHKLGKWLILLGLIAVVMAIGVYAFAGIDQPESTPKPPPKKPVDPAKGFYDQAMRLVNEGSTDQAIQVLEGLIAAYPNSPYASKARQEIESLRSSTVSTPTPPSRTTTGSPSYKKSDLATMVQVPSGRFLMGSPGDESGRDSDEGQHWVTISKGFLMGTTEVTQGQWQKVMGSNPSKFSGCGDECPVESVSWFEAVDFCNRLSDLEGLTPCYSGTGNAIQWDRSCTGYRLPTEAEWEYAARAGSTTALYTGPLTIRGDNNGPELDPIAWYGGNSGVSYSGGYDCSDWKDKQYSSSTCGTHPVARKRGNDWGLYDMLGNVWEWTWDWKDSYPSGSVADPTGPSGGSNRVIRGGSWRDFARYCRSAFRFYDDPGDRDFSLGFRLARSLP